MFQEPHFAYENYILERKLQMKWNLEIFALRKKKKERKKMQFFTKIICLEICQSHSLCQLMSYI